jgi:hypothetical protein
MPEEILPEVGDLVGRTLLRVEGEVGQDRITFFTDNGEEYALWHQQDCCESVSVDDIVGDLNDLVGSPLTIAREDSNIPTEPKEQGEYPDESFTWTFYNFATVKGYVTIKWYGSSNGYYSESVSFTRVR